MESKDGGFDFFRFPKKIRGVRMITGFFSFCFLVLDTNKYYDALNPMENHMQKNTSVTLGPHFDNFIASQVKEGRFNSASEAIRAGLRLLEEREAKVKALQLALIEGEKSGIAEYSLEKLSADLDG